MPQTSRQGVETAVGRIFGALNEVAVGVVEHRERRAHHAGDLEGRDARVQAWLANERRSVRAVGSHRASS